MTDYQIIATRVSLLKVLSVYKSINANVHVDHSAKLCRRMNSIEFITNKGSMIPAITGMVVMPLSDQDVQELELNNILSDQDASSNTSTVDMHGLELYLLSTSCITRATRAVLQEWMDNIDLYSVEDLRSTLKLIKAEGTIRKQILNASSTAHITLLVRNYLSLPVDPDGMLEARKDWFDYLINTNLTVLGTQLFGFDKKSYYNPITLWGEYNGNRTIEYNCEQLADMLQLPTTLIYLVCGVSINHDDITELNEDSKFGDDFRQLHCIQPTNHPDGSSTYTIYPGSVEKLVNLIIKHFSTMDIDNDN